MLTDSIVLIILLLLSGFFSSTELAFVVSNKIKIELRARKNKIAARHAQKFIENPDEFFSTILISNNIVNIAFASLATVFLTEAFGYSDYVILIISSLLLLIIGELLPKYFAREFSDSFVMGASIPLKLVYFLLLPLVKLTSSIASILTKSENVNQERYSNLFEKEELQTLITESGEVGKIKEDESDTIVKVFELGEQKIYEAMTPRTDIVGVELNEEIQEVIKTFISSGYSKLPVYSDNMDDIKGFVHAYDMFHHPENLEQIIRPIIFMPETKKSLETLNEFLDKQTSIAVVVDEFGGTAGLITIEDIIEEMLGEIRDEYDVEEEVCKQTDQHSYVISGKVEIDHINEQFAIKIPEGDFETIAGYITSKLGYIPEKGKILNIDHFRIMILRADQKKIELVKLTADPTKMPE